MAHHTSPSFVNSSIYNHSTPAFHFDRTSSFAHASSSSSPLTDDLVTPRDGEKMEGLIRGRMTTGRKDTTRRSVRVREASGHSSPYLTHEIPPNLDYIHSTAHLLPAPALPQLRNPSNTRKRVPPPPQRALTNPSDIFARAQAYGITVDQFENAKQQVRDFLRADPSSANDDKGKGKSLGRSASYAQIEQQMSRPTSPPSDHFSYLPAGAGIASTPAHNGTSEQYYERPISVPSKTVKTRPSLEQIVERSADRRMSGKGRNLMQWSESRENDFSGDEQGAEMVEVDQSRPYGDAPMYNNLPTPHSVRVSHLAHNESPTFSASGSPAMQHPASRQLPSAHRGMLERFMYDREKVEDFQGAPVEPAASQYQHPTHHQQYSPSILLPRNPAPSHSSIFAPPPMPVSPTSSRPSPKDQLCSPDVARLLRSELNELAVQSRRRSVEDDREDGAEDDILAEDKSSPYTSQLEYGDTDYSPGYSTAKRGRNTYNNEPESLKRSRWNDSSIVDNRRVVSPCPSNASMPLRAPSFCDSSPAVSDRSTVEQARHYPLSLPMTHSVSAPDFSYLPHQSSSSPASSQSLSDYTPGSKRSSSQLLSSGNSRRSEDVKMYETAPRKRAPAKRSDSSPGSAAVDGYAKPPWSYAALIGQAVYSTETSRISLADIYSFIMTSYPYYKKEDSGWQNSIRHNLSLNDCFVKTARGEHNPGKGCLWAIAAGCEEQFTGGGFIKKGGVGAATKKKKATLNRSESVIGTRTKKVLPVEVSISPASSRASSPASVAPMSAPRSQVSVAPQPSPLATMAPLRKISPIPQVEADVFSPAPPTPTLPAPYSQPAAIASENFPPRAGLHRRHTSISLQSVPQEESIPIVEKKVRLAPAYELRPVPATGSAPPSVQKAAARDIFASPVLASPPTSVYNRLAGPYQPLGYSLSSAQNHRALALLASPEAAGIMPVDPSVYTTRSVVPSSAGLPPTPFPPLSIFPSTGRTRQPTSEFSTNGTSPQPLNTRSPVSSLRHSTLDEKMIILPSLDPEKRSYHTSPKRSRSHLPSVVALAAESMTPPRHLRSPTGHLRTRSIGTLTALHGTPGGRVGWNDPFGGIEELNPYDRNVQTGFWPSPTGGAPTMW